MIILYDVALLVLRIALGIVFIAHGLQKTFGTFGGPGIKGTSDMLMSLGITPSLLWAWVDALGELIGGLFVISGAFPRIGAVLIASSMLVAIFKVHLSKGFFIMQGGFEYAFLALMVSVSIIIAGGGKFSLFNKF